MAPYSSHKSRLMVKLELNITPKLAKIGKKEGTEREALIVRIKN